MENGRFAVLIVIMVALIGAVGYYANSRAQGLSAQIEQVRARADDASTAAAFARSAALEAKTAVAGLTNANAKSGDIAQLVKQATDAATEAKQSADEAKQAAAELTGAEKGRREARRR